MYCPCSVNIGADLRLCFRQRMLFVAAQFIFKLIYTILGTFRNAFFFHAFGVKIELYCVILVSLLENTYMYITIVILYDNHIILMEKC